MEDAYYEEEMRVVANNMFSEAHMLGEGLESTSGFSQMLCVSLFFIQHPDHTIAVISVESQELVQFGSTQKVSTLKANRVNLTILQKIYLGPGWGVIPFIKNILFLHLLTDEKANIHDLPHIKRGVVGCLLISMLLIL
ncbi:hypothetical protein NC651_003585 [Populus alba x Populus x berolinensis]|nr:hypothetical protein NC651_003585 [Populus alba x Populus x berolinensis]